MDNEQQEKLEHEFDRELTEGEAEEIMHTPVAHQDIENLDATPFFDMLTTIKKLPDTKDRVSLLLASYYTRNHFKLYLPRKEFNIHTCFSRPA